MLFSLHKIRSVSFDKNRRNILFKCYKYDMINYKIQLYVYYAQSKGDFNL